MAAAVGAASLLALTACGDEAAVSPNGTTWVFTPDVALHQSTGKPWITFTGLCSNGSVTWWARSAEANANNLTQGQTMTAYCGGGWATGGGNWGLEEHW